MTYSAQPKMWFWILAILFLLWNLMGLGALSSEIFTPDVVTDLMSEEQLELYNNRPSWYMTNYGIAVFTGLFTTIALLFKRKIAVLLSLISFITILISTGYHTSTGEWNMMEPLEKVFFIAIPVLGLLLWLFTRISRGKGWLK